MREWGFIDEKAIFEALSEVQTEPARIRDIIAKARELKGLNLSEAAALLKTQDRELEEEIFQAARDVKLSIYGRRLVLFAPLYIDNHCTNNCLYCAFRRHNSELVRRTLTLDEVAAEIRMLEDQGHKRLLMLMGEDSSHCTLDYFISAIDKAYATKTDKGEIRRINVEIAPLSVDDFRRLKLAKIGTYVVFQETYHRATYRQVHPSGRKADYEWRF